MFISSALSLAATASLALGAAAANVVPGKAFDRMAIIYLENTDYDKAYGDCKLRMTHHMLQQRNANSNPIHSQHEMAQEKRHHLEQLLCYHSSVHAKLHG